MAPPGLTSDSAKEVRLSADGYRGSGDRLEEARPAEDLVRVVDSEDAPRDEELKEEGEAPLLASVTVASPEEESWEASAPLVLPAGCHEARRSRVPPPLIPYHICRRSQLLRRACQEEGGATQGTQLAAALVIVAAKADRPALLAVTLPSGQPRRRRPCLSSPPTQPRISALVKATQQPRTRSAMLVSTGDATRRECLGGGDAACGR